MIVLVDGSNIVYRYSFAFDPSTSGRIVCNLIKFCKEVNADGIIVVWDGGLEEKRKIFPNYKSGRVIDENIREIANRLFLELKRIFSYSGFIQCQIPSYEADDIIASFIKFFNQEDFIIYSNDRDFYSLLSEKVKIWNFEKFITLDSFRKEFGIEPNDWIKVRSLSGDSVDSIPGVPGIGIVKALKILKENRYSEFESREDVSLYRKVFNFLDIPQEVLLKSLNFGELNKTNFRLFLERSKIDFNYFFELLNLNRKNFMRYLKLDDLKKSMEKCSLCDLSKTAKNVVTFLGNSSDILVIGEAPAEEDDAVGVPFVGQAGKKLEEWLLKVGLSINNVIISNIVWHRPVDINRKNRNPTPSEILFCSSKGIERLIYRLVPHLIISLGDISASFIFNSEIKVSRDYGLKCSERFGFPIDVWVLPHPVSVLHSSVNLGIVESELVKMKNYLKEKKLV